MLSFIDVNSNTETIEINFLSNKYKQANITPICIAHTHKYSVKLERPGI
jgi:hypothetical protein